MMTDPYTLDEKGLRLAIRVMPGAKRSGIEGVHDHHIKIALKAPPVDGQANEALIAFLKDFFKVKKSDIFIVTGEFSRCKLVFIQTEQGQEKTQWLTHALSTEKP